jgi:ADP-ribose pyrophosphatase
LTEYIHRVRSSRKVFEGSIFTVVVDDIETDRGGIRQHESVRHPGAVAIVAARQDGDILLVRQPRHSVGDNLLELPAGKLKPDEDPWDCARRELEEETGFRCGSLDLLCTFYTSPGFTNEKIHLFEGHDLEAAGTPRDTGDGEDITVEWMDPHRAMTAISEGSIVDAKTIIGLSMRAGEPVEQEGAPA